MDAYYRLAGAGVASYLSWLKGKLNRGDEIQEFHSEKEIGEI